MTLTDSRDVGYSATVTVTVTLSDGARGTRTVFESITTPPRPPDPATVTVTRGSLKNVDGCKATWCAYVMVTTKNFAGTTTCHISGSDLYGAWGTSWTQGGNETKDSGRFYGGHSITVTCTGGGVTMSGTNSNWKP